MPNETKNVGISIDTARLFNEISYKKRYTQNEEVIVLLLLNVARVLKLIDPKPINMADYKSDIAFSDSVKSWQEKMGSRELYEKMANRRDWEDKVTPQLEAFLKERDSFYLASANTEGQPYIQHRGGPKGFLKKLDDHTLGFVDYSGNRQYISVGNLSENKKVSLFLMDYPNRTRIKIWGTAEIIENDDQLTAQLLEPEYRAKPERVIAIHVKAWDVNCPQHIQQRYTLEEIEPHLERLRNRIQELEEKLENCEPKEE